MTVPNKTYRGKVETATLLMGFSYSGGSSTEYQPSFSYPKLSLEDGLDEMVKAQMAVGVGHWATDITPGLDHLHLNWGIMPNISNGYAMPEIAAAGSYQAIIEFRSYQTGVGTWLNSKQDNLVADGLYLEATGLDPGGPDVNGEYVYYSALVWNLKIFFMNAIVNDIDRFWAPTAGGVAVVLTGLGFKNSNSDLNGVGPTNPGDHAAGWEDNVLSIGFVGLQGQGTTTLTRTGGDFTVDSNTQITIPANKFPALSAGSYSLYIIKRNYGGISDPVCYAGDWRCDSTGAVFAGNRITFYITDTYVDRPFRTRKAPILLSDWHLKDRSDGTEIMKYYSMNTIRCPDRVYKGNLSTISSIPRGFEDKTGLFKVSDLTLNLANNDLEFSKLMAGTTILKNQIVKLYQAYPDEPFGWRSHIISLIIDDYYFEDEIFKVKLKDITQKYFRVAVPRGICTEDEYENIHPDSVGAFIPEVLGLCSLTSGEFRGQIEALCIDTTTFKYVAANRALKEITEVYSDDNTAVDSGDYTITIEGDGRTYITFDADQGNKKVTYNAKGYIYSGMNSDNNYVQNPAYIFLYFLLEILNLPPTMIDFGSFIRAATVFDNMGEAEAGKLILQNDQNPMDVTQDLMAGAKCYPRKDGRLALGMKDMSNWGTNEGQTVPVIFRQLDIVGKFSRKYNMRDAINTINAEYDYIPTWDIFKSSESYRGDVWIDPGEFIPVEDPSTAPTTRRGRGGRRRTRDWAR